jgi:hypothetical protein
MLAPREQWTQGLLSRAGLACALALAAALNGCNGADESGGAPGVATTQNESKSPPITGRPPPPEGTTNPPQVADVRSISQLMAAGYNVDAISKVMLIGQGGDGEACDLRIFRPIVSHPEVFVTPRDVYASDRPEVGSPMAFCVTTAKLTEFKVLYPDGRESVLLPGPERGGANVAALYIFAAGFDDPAGSYQFTGYEGSARRFELNIAIRDSITPRILARRPADLRVGPSSTIEFLVVGLRSDSVVGLYRLVLPRTRGHERYDLVTTLKPVIDQRGRSNIRILLDSVHPGDCLALHTNPPKPGSQDGGTDAYPVQYATFCIA